MGDPVGGRCRYVSAAVTSHAIPYLPEPTLVATTVNVVVVEAGATRLLHAEQGVRELQDVEDWKEENGD